MHREWVFPLRILVFSRWGESFDFSLKEEDTDWDFLNMEGISLPGREKTGKKFWEHIFLQWKLLYMKNKIPGITANVYIPKAVVCFSLCAACTQEMKPLVLSADSIVRNSVFNH